MDISSLTSGLNPLNLLGNNPLGGLQGADAANPLALLSQLFNANGAGQDQGSQVSASASGGAANSGCCCCQKNDALGF